jgi:hypothetical protein
MGSPRSWPGKRGDVAGRDELYDLLVIKSGWPINRRVGVAAGRFDGLEVEARRDDPNWKASAIPCLLAALFGVVGAITSAAQRSTKMSGVTLIGELQALGASFSRVPIGAVAGLTVWLFSVAAVGDVAMNLNIADMLLAAFGAGFAERLIVQGARPERPDASSR